MTSLLSTFTFETIIIILLIGIPAIVNFITWCKKVWKQREQFKNDNIQEGREIEAKAEAKEGRFQRGERRIDDLEKVVQKLTEFVEQQNKINSRFEQSDRLAIKTYIKEQHDIWVPKGCIDSQILELLEQRYEIYKEEGGNSWAEKLMVEMRQLPIVVVVPVQNAFQSNED